MSSKSKVAIIGCGLAGPILALKLKQSNIDITIFETRTRNRGPEGGYLLMTPNALRILDSLGLYEPIKNEGFNYQHIKFVSGRNLRVLGTVTSGGKARYGYDALRISRDILRKTILEELERQGVKVRYGAKCVRIEEHDKGVTLKFANGDVEHATLVVGADGIHSRVREHLAPGSKPVFSGQIHIGGLIHKDKMAPAITDLHLPCMVLGKNNSFMMMPTTFDGQSVGGFITVEGEERSREEINEAAKDKEYLAKLMREGTGDGWPELVAATGRDIMPESLSIWPFYAVPALDSWVSASGNLVLIGDSAHAIPPTAGQGGACTFEDAASLGEALKVVFNENEDGEGVVLNATQLGVLKKWEAHRQARVKKITDVSRTSGDAQKRSAGLVQQVVKEWVIWAFFLWSGPEVWSWVYDYDVKQVKFI